MLSRPMRTAPVALALFIANCGPKPILPTPQERFEGLYRACRSLQGATTAGVSYATFGELQQRLATELLIASDHASAEDEKAMIKAYSDAATTYKDSATLWKHQIESSKYDWTKGQIFQEAELVPIVAKYKLPTSQQTLRGASSWTAIPAEAVQQVWLKAEEESDKARRLYFALGEKKGS